MGGSGRWARKALAPYRRHAGRLTLAAVDAETFGHHHPREYQFLRWLMRYEVDAVGFEITTLERYFEQNPPEKAVKIKERTAWSCHHGLARWAAGCSCTPGYSSWKGALRRALDNLASEIDLLYVRLVDRFGVDPWALRDGYIAVALGRIDGPGYLRQSGLEFDSDDDLTGRVLDMLRAQYHAQAMYSSCAFFFEEIQRPEPRYAISNGVYALHLAKRATDVDLSARFYSDLAVVYSEASDFNGATVYDSVLREFAETVAT
jgi:hypothetical protein